MFRLLTPVSLLIGLFMCAPSMGASAVHKCEANGKVTFQSGPCSSGAQAPRPTVEQLNGERKKRTASATPAPAAASQSAEEKATPAAAPAPPPLPGIKAVFRCDARKYCSQMTSCAEAKYFLANCPGVNMDGDRNGVPCERQWCNP